MRELPVRLCTRCGHMAGTGTAGDCRSCGHGGSRVACRPLLVFDRTAHGPALERDDVHAAGARTPMHLFSIAQHAPRLLVLSRTRDHGVDLVPLGLEGMVLDPRAGLHVAVLAAAAESRTSPSADGTRPAVPPGARLSSLPRHAAPRRSTPLHAGSRREEVLRERLRMSARRRLGGGLDKRSSSPTRVLVILL